MNAIITLNHFCEVHGPQTIFTTQTIRDKSYMESSFQNENQQTSSKSQAPCESCGSIGTKIYFVSSNNSIMFVSSEKSIFEKELQSIIKQAALRSLCEISPTADHEGLVFFGDSKINSLCYTFKVKDSFARGFEKLYSINVLMKDKLFLLNYQPFIAQNIKEIVNQIQENAIKVYEGEQKQCSHRAERLNSGKLLDLPQRSLKELVGEQHIFAQLHSIFSWILWAGGSYFTETLTLGTPSVSSIEDRQTDGFTFISIDKEEFLMQNFQTSFGDNGIIYDGEYNLRNLRLVTKSSFNHVLYCALVGIQIVIRGQNNDFYKFFKELMPSEFHHLILESPKFIPVQKCRILAMTNDVCCSTSMPQNLNNICRIDFVDNANVPTYIKCPTELPAKLPTLMTKILYALDEKLFSSHTMQKWICTCMEEWRNKVLCMSQHLNHQDLKKVMEIQQQDEDLVKYWSSVL